MTTRYTERGFAMYAEFPYDTYTNTPERVAFTVQESSAASERKVWIGAGSDRAHLTEDQARIARDALTEFLDRESPDVALEISEVRRLRNAIADVLVNASNYPKRVGVHVLGQDMSSLIAKVTGAVEMALNIRKDGQ